MIMLSEEHYDHSGSYLERQLQMIEAIVQAVRCGDFAEAELDDIVARVVAFKNARLAALPRPAAIDFEANRTVARKAAEQAVAILSNPRRLLPLKPGQRLLIVQTAAPSDYGNLMNPRGIGPNQATPAFDSFLAELAPLWPASQRRVIGQDQALAELASLGAAEGELIIAVTESYPLPGEDFGGEGIQQLMTLILETCAERTVVLGLRSEYETGRWPAAAAAATSHLCAQSSRACSARAAARRLVALAPG